MLRLLLGTIVCAHIALGVTVNEFNFEGRHIWHTDQPVTDFKSKEFWTEDAQRVLREKLQTPLNKKVAKNVIFFIGDGMSVPTVTASRIYEGQSKGLVGERHELSFEQFPHVGLSKTYCVDKQVADSACTATAYLCGIKANYYTIGVSADVKLNDCPASNSPLNQVDSIAAWAQEAGKGTGIVTTTRITHASPAGAYAHTANRDFESDFDVVDLGYDPKVCIDVARQLVENPTSSRFSVILGGGTTKFLPNSTVDDASNTGERLDGRNLIREWTQQKEGSAIFVQNRHQLQNVDYGNTNYLLGLFSSSHMPYHLDQAEDTPSLAEMTEVAIRMLAKEEKGFVLFVEGGRIDHAHHDTLAVKALDETVEFAKAIEKALAMTNEKETLIVVSSDHSHTMTINGYPNLGNPITGVGNDLSDMDNLPYATLSYANGPAFSDFLKGDANGEVKRVDLRTIANFGHKDFKYPAAVPILEETHGGGDVAIYANGPWAHLFTGVLEQNTLPALMGYAACIGPGLHVCRERPFSQFFPIFSQKQNPHK